MAGHRTARRGEKSPGGAGRRTSGCYGPVMAYREPAWFVRNVFNPLALRTGLSGTRPLEVARRRSGGMQRVPVVPVEVRGERYLVSPRGESQWVRNLRAAGGRGRLAGEAFAATEIPAQERPPILDVYRKVAGMAVAPHFKALPDPADHPVFRLGPAD
jgi:hypothetical protein